MSRAPCFTPTFAVSRVVGWCANVLEQAQGGRSSARRRGTSVRRPADPRARACRCFPALASLVCRG
ncbi:citrate/2-methylcitrate synthase [Kibdelosporangium banguiense]|uniref:citrate/2-methylcitrate synthase n=1 Tax=Kibdelosporangium banguiense TaxID=1365924 RepID=UPI003556985F